MGQQWKIIAPHRRATLGNLGKLGEGLFDGSPAGLVTLLAVPIIPNGFYADPSDGQASLDSKYAYLPAPKFFFANSDPSNSDGQRTLPAKDDCTPPPTGQAAKGKGPETTNNQLVKRKAAHEEEEQHDRDAKRRKLSTANESLPTTMNTHTFATLPAELLTLILLNLTIHDVLSVAFTNRRLCNAGLNCIKPFWISPLGSWAETNIICIGEYLEATDNPADILTELEQEEILDGWTTDEEDVEDEQDIPMTLDTLAEERYERVERWDKDLVIQGILRHSSYYKLPKSHRDHLRQSLKFRESDFYPYDRSWILRNLTTHEYVRSEAIAIKLEHIHGPFIEHLGFGEVILSRICWVPEARHLKENPDSIDKGIWAGHKFDITTLDRHRQGTGGLDWRDVSEEVAAEIAGIWETEFGSNWRDIISGNERMYQKF